MSDEARLPVAPRLAVVLVNERRELTRLAELVDGFGKNCALSNDTVHTLNILLDEIVSNVIKYGYDDKAQHQIHVSVQLDHDVLTIAVDDDGRAFNPLAAPPPNLDLPIEQRPIGGLGVYLVRSMVDHADYRRADGRNYLTLTKKTLP